MKQLRPYQEDAVTSSLKELQYKEPVLLMASVGAGKSLMLARILLEYQNQNKKCLCLINNAELVRSNAEAFRQEGGKASIYCASLNEKDLSESVIFATSQSAYAGINKDIGQIKFDLIVVDEAHTINYLNKKSTFMRLLTRYYVNNSELRVLGATGTNFRFKGTNIVGEDCLFKKQVANITTQQLIQANYLVKPKFSVDPNLIIDFSKVGIRNGQFIQKDLQKVVDENERLTYQICKQIIKIREETNRFGVFIFASTKKHAKEILSYLPEEESALILGETPQDERNNILNKARCGKLRYIVNISIISVGVDIPAFDTIAYLRPTESLVLIVQTMGRALRLSPETNKTDALVLDFAGNIERHENWDNPILLDALKQTRDFDKPYDIRCPACQTMNTHSTRRCIGVIDNKRCDFFFEFKECEECNAQNDIAARLCRICDAELIDPNNKLTPLRNKGNIELNVISMAFKLMEGAHWYLIRIVYSCKDSNNRKIEVSEKFTISSLKSRNYFYAVYIKNHLEQPSTWYKHLDNVDRMREMLRLSKVPSKIFVTQAFNGDYKIKDKYFENAS